MGKLYTYVRELLKKAGRMPPAEARAALERDVRANYAHGFDFSENALRLVSARAGGDVSAAVAAAKAAMFRRHDGMYFLPDQVASAEARAALARACAAALARLSKKREETQVRFEFPLFLIS